MLLWGKAQVFKGCELYFFLPLLMHKLIAKLDLESAERTIAHNGVATVAMTFVMVSELPVAAGSLVT